MIIRFPLRWFCIMTGILCCIYGSFLNIHNQAQETLQSGQIHYRPLIIDAGHGGTDGGAVAIDGTEESTINLEIAQRLNTLANLFGVPTIMTRESEEINYPPDADTISERKTADQKARLRLIQDYPHGILYSIHQNTYPNAKITGIQILYGHTDDSTILGTKMQENLNNALNPNSRRIAAEISKDIYLLRNCDCTAVLIECGFISNPEECRLLQSGDYQKKIVAAMVATYFQFLTT